jgi:UrcA family protein
MDSTLPVWSGVVAGTCVLAALRAFADTPESTPPTPSALQITTAYTRRSPELNRPVSEVTVTAHVSSRDLDLGTREGLLTLEARVRAAAVQVCDALRVRGQPDRDAERRCVDTVAAQALARSRKLLAEAH